MAVRKKRDECDTILTVCLYEESNDYVKKMQDWVKHTEKKTSFNKDQAINRIIQEYAQSHPITKVVTKMNP